LIERIKRGDSEHEEKEGNAGGRTVKERQIRLPNPGTADGQLLLIGDCEAMPNKTVKSGSLEL